MNRLTLDQVIAKSEEIKVKSGATPEALALESRMIRELAKGKPLSAEQVADITGMPLEAVRQSFASGRQQDASNFTEDGKVLGNALSLIPTQHHFRVNDQNLYAWCSYDAIFLPGLLGEAAEVNSTCPATGEAIWLSVTPDGIAGYSPKSTVLSIYLAGSGSDDDAQKPAVGPESARCSSMHFFSSREVAEEYLKDRPDLAILTVEEAYQLALETLLKPYWEGLESVGQDAAPA